LFQLRDFFEIQFTEEGSKQDSTCEPRHVLRKIPRFACSPGTRQSPTFGLNYWQQGPHITLTVEWLQHAASIVMGSTLPSQQPLADALLGLLTCQFARFRIIGGVGNEQVKDVLGMGEQQLASPNTNTNGIAVKKLATSEPT
jgi:hypothetical protein